MKKLLMPGSGWAFSFYSFCIYLLSYFLTYSTSVLSVTTQKTNVALNIKLNSYALAILDKYKDQYFPGDLALPVITNQRMNSYLKTVCKLCDINEPIRITGFKNGRRYDIVRPKYSEMSTHADYKSMKPYIDIVEKAKTDAMDAMEKALSG